MTPQLIALIGAPTILALIAIGLWRDRAQPETLNGGVCADDHAEINPYR